MMTVQEGTATNYQSMIDNLASKDGAIRQKARQSLVALGTPAVSSLTQALANSTSDHVRWEAVKALGEIGDSGTIPSFVEALEDSSPDVAWLAAEGLRKFGKTAWPPLLRVLIKSGSESAPLRQGAHHVLNNQHEEGFNDLLGTLTKALESSSFEEATPLAASDILKRMKAST